ncbi:unnamed protein product [Caenorhabditis sp. 36 PRJEB53466]|nr:unnamed protein product [Caenorhabditis sp. 36 PRJEB53466]
MDLDVFSTNVQNIGKLRSGIDEFHKLAAEIRKEEHAVQSLEKHIAKCDGVRTELDLERRNHAEELRQINQDINTLEDITKSTTNELEKRKRKITVTLAEVDGLREFINGKLAAMNILHKLEPSEEELRYQRTSGRPNSSQELISADDPRIPAFLQCFLQNTGSSQPVMNVDGTPNLVNRHRMPPSFVAASKMKICENCGANIHRNAPTCPMCKMKTRSKNPKKKSKRTYSGSGI